MFNKLEILSVKFIIVYLENILLKRFLRALFLLFLLLTLV